MNTTVILLSNYIKNLPTDTEEIHADEFFDENLPLPKIKWRDRIEYIWNPEPFTFSRFTNLTHLFLDLCELTVLPKLPPTLLVLNCAFNDLCELPELPLGLRVLQCENNKLKKLPHIHGLLYHLNCSDNNIEELDVIEQQMHYLNCENNKIKKLWFHPNCNLMYFHCKGNPIQYIENFPSKLLNFSM